MADQQQKIALIKAICEFATPIEHQTEFTWGLSNPDLARNTDATLNKKIGDSAFYTSITTHGLILFSNEWGHPEAITALSQTGYQAPENTNIAIIIGQGHFTSWLPALAKCNINMILFLDCTADVLSMNMLQAVGLRTMDSYARFRHFLCSKGAQVLPVFDKSSERAGTLKLSAQNFDHYKALANDFAFIAVQADLCDVRRIVSLCTVIRQNGGKIAFFNTSNVHHYMGNYKVTEVSENLPLAGTWEITNQQFLTSLKILAADNGLICFSRMDSWRTEDDLFRQDTLYTQLFFGCEQLIAALTNEKDRINTILAYKALLEIYLRVSQTQGISPAGRQLTERLCAFLQVDATTIMIPSRRASIIAELRTKLQSLLTGPPTTTTMKANLQAVTAQEPRAASASAPVPAPVTFDRQRQEGEAIKIFVRPPKIGSRAGDGPLRIYVRPQS